MAPHYFEARQVIFKFVLPAHPHLLLLPSSHLCFSPIRPTTHERPSLPRVILRDPQHLVRIHMPRPHMCLCGNPYHLAVGELSLSLGVFSGKETVFLDPIGVLSNCSMFGKTG